MSSSLSMFAIKTFLPRTMFVFLCSFTVWQAQQLCTAFPASAAASRLSAAAARQSVYYVAARYDSNQLLRVVERPIVYTDGILFTYLAPTPNTEVSISGSFVDWQLNIKLSPNALGIHSVWVPLNFPPGRYSYKFNVDGIWINDPQQPYRIQETQHLGTAVTEHSAFQLSQVVEQHLSSPVARGQGLFTFYLADKGYTRVSWVGTANLWHPTRDAMVLKNGYWQLTRHLPIDAPYYLLLADGNLSVDPLNVNIAATRFQPQVSVAQGGGYFLSERN